MAAGQFRVLIIESDAAESGLLQDILRQCGKALIGGQELAIFALADVPSVRASYSQLSPDLVIFGPLAARSAQAEDLHQLRTMAGAEPAPILFVKAESETISSACLNAGCDDIILKPYYLPLVQLKLAAIRRFVDFNRTLVAQRNRIRRHRADLLQEQAGARQIFDNMSHESCLDQTRAIRYHLSPRAVLNGDVLAAAYAPGGKLVLLLGDFTGHGLAAAVGAVPLTSIFYSMVPKGFSLSHILREINDKLHGILPPQMFCCALMFELDPHKKHIRLFNAGMPRACLYRRGGEIRMLESRHLPLGVLAETSVEDAIAHISVEQGDRLYLWSDGIHEARDQRGELFGEERLLQTLSATVPDWQRFEHILAQVNAFAADQLDDLSLVEVALADVEPGVTRQQPVGAAQPIDGGVGNWSIDFTFGAEELRGADPLPLLHNMLAQIPGAASFRDDLTVVLGELFRNALEHGLLGLDSALKQTEQGFANYYRQLRIGRRQLRQGWVKIGLRCHSRAEGGRLEVLVEDSGSGFPPDTQQCNAYSGRGLPLLRAICRELELVPGSSRVRALLQWEESPRVGWAKRSLPITDD
jgi:serine phosphatase RsbU (regulator of sigma subunit)